MNAKELRRAAWTADTHMGDGIPDCWQPIVKSLSAHILATVREDDDKLLDERWFMKQTRVDGPLSMIVLIRRAEGFHIAVNGHESDRPATRGDFRTLCGLLGVKLDEPA